VEAWVGGLDEFTVFSFKGFHGVEHGVRPDYFDVFSPVRLYMCNGDVEMETVTLDYVLRFKNADGKPYICDIKRWLGIDSWDKAKEVQELLIKLQDKL
jgi:hypothetical protein